MAMPSPMNKMGGDKSTRPYAILTLIISNFHTTFSVVSTECYRPGN